MILNGFSNKRLKEKISIGILGTEIGCGATHLAIAIANYLQSGMGKRTAVIELSGCCDLSNMIRKEGDSRQELLGIHYFTDILVGNVPEIINSNYEAFVLDLGTDYEAVREEFLRCDRKIVIGSISPWKKSAYEHFLYKVTTTENYKLWEFLVLFANLLDKKIIQKRYGVHMLSVPWIENPFYLKREDMMFLQKMI